MSRAAHVLYSHRCYLRHPPDSPPALDSPASAVASLALPSLPPSGAAMHVRIKCRRTIYRTVCGAGFATRPGAG